MNLAKKIIYIFISSILLIHLSNKDFLAGSNSDSIIKMFCLENIKDEMSKAHLSYDEEIANSTCKCYLEEFSQTKSHQKSISICRSETKEKFKF